MADLSVVPGSWLLGEGERGQDQDQDQDHLHPQAPSPAPPPPDIFIAIMDSDSYFHAAVHPLDLFYVEEEQEEVPDGDGGVESEKVKVNEKRVEKPNTS